MLISCSTARKILKESGAERINKDAAIEFQKYINTISFEKANKSVLLAKHAKRKTIEVSDIKLAIK